MEESFDFEKKNDNNPPYVTKSNIFESAKDNYEEIIKIFEQLHHSKISNKIKIMKENKKQWYPKKTFWNEENIEIMAQIITLHIKTSDGVHTYSQNTTK